MYALERKKWRERGERRARDGEKKDREGRQSGGNEDIEERGYMNMYGQCSKHVTQLLLFFPCLKFQSKRQAELYNAAQVFH